MAVILRSTGVMTRVWGHARSISTSLIQGLACSCSRMASSSTLSSVVPSGTSTSASAVAWSMWSLPITRTSVAASSEEFAMTTASRMTAMKPPAATNTTLRLGVGMLRRDAKPEKKDPIADATPASGLSARLSTPPDAWGFTLGAPVLTRMGFGPPLGRPLAFGGNVTPPALMRLAPPGIFALGILTPPLGDEAPAGPAAR